MIFVVTQAGSCLSEMTWGHECWWKAEREAVVRKRALALLWHFGGVLVHVVASSWRPSLSLAFLPGPRVQAGAATAGRAPALPPCEPAGVGVQRFGVQ